MYPNKYSSSDQVFVKMLVDEFARQGHECVVVCPFNTFHYRHISKGKYTYSVGNNTVRVICPNYISASNLTIGKFNVSEYLHLKAIDHALNKLDFRPDVIYCHFWKQGFKAFKYARKHDIPMIVASGECEIFIKNHDGRLDDFAKYVKGVICVSTKNMEESVAVGLTSPEKCYVVPNSIDNSLFKKLCKSECRKKLDFPQDKFIIAFVGWFANRKGSLRVSEAVSKIEESDVYSIFIGSGDEVPSCKNILFTGKVNHDDIPLYLSAADAFVLPTLQEGCCNAVIEAMACGLPIVSSNLPFNWDVLNSENSIMVDPMNVEEIKSAIIKLRDDHALRNKLSNGALRSAADLTISERAKKIIDFIQDKIQ